MQACGLPSARASALGRVPGSSADTLPSCGSVRDGFWPGGEFLIKRNHVSVSTAAEASGSGFKRHFIRWCGGCEEIKSSLKLLWERTFGIGNKGDGAPVCVCGYRVTYFTPTVKKTTSQFCVWTRLVRNTSHTPDGHYRSLFLPVKVSFLTKIFMEQRKSRRCPRPQHILRRCFSNRRELFRIGDDYISNMIHMILSHESHRKCFRLNGAARDCFDIFKIFLWRLTLFKCILEEYSATKYRKRIFLNQLLFSKLWKSFFFFFLNVSPIFRSHLKQLSAAPTVLSLYKWVTTPQEKIKHIKTVDFSHFYTFCVHFFNDWNCKLCSRNKHHKPKAIRCSLSCKSNIIIQLSVFGRCQKKAVEPSENWSAAVLLWHKSQSRVMLCVFWTCSGFHVLLLKA